MSDATYVNPVVPVEMPDDEYETVELAVEPVSLTPLPSSIVRSYAGFKARGMFPKEHKAITDLIVQNIRNTGGDLAEFTLGIEDRDDLFLEVLNTLGGKNEPNKELDGNDK
jgi:hypothetical protein